MAGFLLMTLGRAVREHAEDQLKPYGVSLRHVSALGHLSREPGLSYSELGRRAGVTAQSMLATLRQLEELGAVERRTEPGRGRTAELHVTAHGAELVRRGTQAITAAEDVVLAGLHADQRNSLADLLGQAFAAQVSQGGGRAVQAGPPG